MITLNRSTLHALPLIAIMAVCLPAAANLVPERTRLIIDEGQKTTSLVVRNLSPSPYLAQAYMDAYDETATSSPVVALPPIQRIEGKDQGVVRVSLHDVSQLPDDRESVFYLNIQEVPPKSDRPNVLQIAVKSRMKVFYRPRAAELPRGSNPAEQLEVHVDRAAGTVRVTNPTPWHVSVVKAAWGRAEDTRLNGLMVKPFDSIDFPLGDVTKDGATLYLSNIDDYGATRRLRFGCQASICKLIPEPHGDAAK